MKVLMLGRPELKKHYGGDRIQIENTAKELQKLGVEVDIRTDTKTDMAQYDLVHVFQLDWNPSCYFFIKKAREFKKPVVFSPIHHSLKEVMRFEEEYAFDFRRISGWLIKNQYHRDLLKDIYKTVIYPGKLPLTAYSMFMGLEKMYKKALQLSDILLVQTKLEAEDIMKTFNINVKWVKVMNGVGDVFLKTPEATEEANIFKTGYMVCVGRIEPRKNQLNIIEAVKQLRDELHQDIQLVFIGAKSRNKHFEYIWRFNNALKKYNWIVHLDFVDYGKMPTVYKYSKVGISASWFETTGLTSLEALICGANAVASGDRAKECLGDLASYCDPGSVESIKEAVKKEYLAPRPVLPESFKQMYTWETAAKETLEVYKKLL
jgi:glycosyltransferase involved in cell wall biosynthesis